jgi:murein DD-endopeptidase MepM/ murein hydrolase activator NlpD
MFFQALNKVPGWQNLPVGQAAQTVQRSAFPDAYNQWEQPADGLVALIQSKTVAGGSAAVAMIDSGMCGPAGAASCPDTGLPSELGLTPDALRVLRCVASQWSQLRSFQGLDQQTRDHQEGRAVDVMLPDGGAGTGKKLGDAVASWVVANHVALGVQYVVWSNRIWNVDHASSGWQPCGSQPDCSDGSGSPAAFHDHVHVTVFGDQAGSDSSLGPIVLPVDHYVLTARFGQCGSHWANCHTGLDFAAPEGTPIRAVMNGTVVWTGWGGAYGNLTKIQNAGNLQTWYAHQSAIGVKVGETVSAGQIIGRIGATGNATGPHLHLEVRTNGTPIDPQQWLTVHGVKP